ncbi:MAG: hypothetical protein AB8I80_02595 [Anaerolineae bacterium]|jgi:hypothetical protein
MTDAVWKGCRAGSLAEVGHVAVDLSQSEQDELIAGAEFVARA